MARRCPFARATRRIVRRVGQSVVIVTDNEVRLDIQAVFSNPQGDMLLKGRQGGLVLKQRQATLLVNTEDVQGINKTWRILVNGVEYFAADSDPDGNGGTVIQLAKTPESNADPLSDNPTSSDKWQ